MILKMAKSGEALAAAGVIAHVRLFAGVDAHVGVEVALLREGLPAGRTHERLLSSLCGKRGE